MQTVPGAPDGKSKPRTTLSLSLSLSPSLSLSFVLSFSLSLFLSLSLSLSVCLSFLFAFYSLRFVLPDLPFVTGLSHPFFGRGFPLYILLLTLLGPDNSFLSQGAGRFPQEINFGGIYPQQPQHLIVTDLSEACCEAQLWKHLG